MATLHRERLSKRIADAANRGVAIVVGPAGYGKTQAIQDAVGDRAIWITVPETAIGIERLAKDLIDAAAPAWRNELSALLTRPVNDETREHLVEWTAAHLRAVDDIIVLDDVHRLLDDAPAVAFLRRVIEATIPATRWVIGAREQPVEWPIASWIAREYTTMPVALTELAFTIGEAAAVAAQLGLDVPIDTLRSIIDEVGGWPIAVRLALHAFAKNGSLPDLRIASRSLLYDHLQVEIWERLTKADHELLSACALLPHALPSVLTAAGFTAVATHLDGLRRRLPLLSERSDGSVHLHDLFREFVSHRVLTDSDARANMLQRLAPAVERHSFEHAIQMWIEGGDATRAIERLGEHGIERIEHGHRGEIAALLKRLPWRERQHPVVTALRGFIASIDGAVDVAETEMAAALATNALPTTLAASINLQRAMCAFNSARHEAASSIARATVSDASYPRDLRLKAAGILATALAMDGDRGLALDAIRFARAGLDRESSDVRVYVMHKVSFAYALIGEYEKAMQLGHDCAELAVALGDEALAARAYSILATTVRRIEADPNRVLTYLQACLRSAEAVDDRPMIRYALKTIYLTAIEIGDDELVRQVSLLLDSQTGSETTLSAWKHIDIEHRWYNVMHLLGNGNRDGAIGEWGRLDRSELSAAESAFADAISALLYAPIDRERSLQLLNKPVVMTADGSLRPMIYLARAQTYHALALWLLGRGRAASRIRLTDLDLAPGDAIDYSVLATIIRTQRQTITGRQIDQLTEPLVVNGKHGVARFLRVALAPAAINELTRSELDVLRELRRGGTTAEVASRMKKSDHTVLSHIRSACTKIGCSGRAQAVQHAVNQGWID